MKLVRKLKSFAAEEPDLFFFIYLVLFCASAMRLEHWLFWSK